MSPERSAESWGEEGGAGSLSPVGEAAPSAEASGWSINAREQGAKGLRKGKGKSWLESSPLLPGGGVIQAGGVRRKGGESVAALAQAAGTGAARATAVGIDMEWRHERLRSQS